MMVACEKGCTPFLLPLTYGSLKTLVQTPCIAFIFISMVTMSRQCLLQCIQLPSTQTVSMRV